MNTLILPAPGRWDLPTGMEAASRARRLARSWMESWAADADEAIADECLAVSELAANAAEHGAPPVALVLSAEHRGDQIAVTTVVHDGGDRMPRVIDAGPDEERHRGLGVVAGLADTWGVREAADGGKDVWFEITLPAGSVGPKTTSLTERIFAALARPAAVRHAVNVPRQSPDLTDERVPYGLTGHAEIFLADTSASRKRRGDEQ